MHVYDYSVFNRKKTILHAIRMNESYRYYAKYNKPFIASHTHDSTYLDYSGL